MNNYKAILLLIFLGPVGLFYMAFHTKWHILMKLLIGILVVPITTLALITVIALIFNVGK